MRIQKWRRITDEETGISLEVGRLRYSERPRLASIWADIYGGLTEEARADEATLRARVAEDPALAIRMMRVQREMIEKIDPEFVEKLFEKRVRGVEELETEDGPVTSGPGFLELADERLIFWVLMELLTDGTVTEEEGKGSASPSTSQPPETGASVSAASSTDNGGGAMHSTAPPIPLGAPSSSAGV